jgi:hypothetical protein
VKKFRVAVRYTVERFVVVNAETIDEACSLAEDNTHEYVKYDHEVGGFDTVEGSVQARPDRSAAIS